MKITILTMFPSLLSSLFLSPLVKRAIEKRVVEIDVVDIKDYSGGSFRHIDDSPCGGGKGMIIRFDTLYRALDSVDKTNRKVVLLSPKGSVYNQKKAREYSREEHIVLICGHYEGVDRRIEKYVDEMVSIGDYILSGGEFASISICDSIIRLLPSVLREGATIEESHENGILEYPQYTKPVEYMGEKVPEILLSGNHEKIKKWKRKEALLDTKRLRPDLFEKLELTEEDKELLST